MVENVRVFHRKNRDNAFHHRRNFLGNLTDSFTGYIINITYGLQRPFIAVGKIVEILTEDKKFPFIHVFLQNSSQKLAERKFFIEKFGTESFRILCWDFKAVVAENFKIFKLFCAWIQLDFINSQAILTNEFIGNPG
jgi:hypothetical protein